MAGTRPEVLKLSPVVTALRRRGSRLASRLCLSGQQEGLAEKAAEELGLIPDVRFPGPERPLALSESLARILERLHGALGESPPDGVIVQGDTTTTLAGALAAFHHGIPCFHVEAGLRTRDPNRPFPEEMNRRLVTRLATLHLAPTEGARDHLLREGVPPESVEVTGNTVVDALREQGRRGAADAERLVAALPPGRALVLVTLHRRESLAGASNVVDAVRALAARADVSVAWIGHPNATGRAAREALTGVPAVSLLGPQPHATFVGLLERARLVLTDSGGVQEEAPVLGVPTVVLRTESDRPESVAAGNAVLVGTDTIAIVQACSQLLDDPDLYARSSRAMSPFGDGRAGERIAEAIERYYGMLPPP